MLAGEEARLDEVEGTETVEPELRTAAEDERWAEAAARAAEEAERAAVDTGREADETVREAAEPAERVTVLPAAEVALGAADLRPSEEPPATLPVPAERPVRTTRPTPERGFAEMMVDSPRVATSCPW